MKKCLLLIALIIVSQLNSLYAQTLFNGPDTVCVNQSVKLTSNIFNASSYYWGFCSGFLFNAPTGGNMGDNFNFNLPAGIDIVNDSGTYYGFVVNTAKNELLRLNFGNSLNNVPSVTNFGNLTLGLPESPTSLYLVKDTLSRNWFLFVSGGFTTATSELARVDFGHRLGNNAPNIANFGNPGGLLNAPKGIFVAQDAGGNWYGYLVNEASNELIQLDFSFNVSNTPLSTNLGNIDGNMNTPTDLAATYDNGKWYLFVTNDATSTLLRIDLGPTLAGTTPVSTDLGDFLFRILRPSSLSITKDCGSIHIYVTDSTTSQLVEVRADGAEGPYSAIDYSIVGGMNFPAGISSIIRDHDNLYAFVTNAKDSTLTRLTWSSCTNATIPSFTEVAPPAYSYNLPGVYNVYYVVNEGLPNMQVECRDITVLAPPTIYMNDDTSICQGDTARLYAISTLADSIRWAGGYNIDTSNLVLDSVRVYPEYSTTYNFTLYYPFGCIVDTNISINVIKVNADAGPDRFIRDGATSMLGGPYTSLSDDPFFNPSPSNYIYHWSPYQFMDDSTLPNPSVTPPYDFTYYLTVSSIIGDGMVCVSRDTVVVRLTCGDLNLPNAFRPTSSNPGSNRFGILNRELSKLNYFRIYNRFGQLVFETTDPTQQWNGMFNGKLADEGVYVWIADGFCLSGRAVKKSGNVTLLR